VRLSGDSVLAFLRNAEERRPEVVHLSTKASHRHALGSIPKRIVEECARVTIRCGDKTIRCEIVAVGKCGLSFPLNQWTANCYAIFVIISCPCGERELRSRLHSSMAKLDERRVVEAPGALVKQTRTPLERSSVELVNPCKISLGLLEARHRDDTVFTGADTKKRPSEWTYPPAREYEPNELLSTAIWWEQARRSLSWSTLYDSVIFIFHSRPVTHYLADHGTANR